ncbi:50S ribosomal protein L11 methyltransferase [Synechococcus sp. Tobar12-5m-g]|uniref:50S ribosomal protein L11 methyltransferase n=1 Tax=unclassified Synechococcus TaxID=2626047 RepID=UPI0020CF04B4|nr:MULTISPECIES: 50S ribosomal protein L11 methyltransferase [unclassified Synechococcus]MCP9771287.1 50S ribosomal protein L11 methyltransferase [Synechococcus sp. Tobar12-5m-g]MCP9872227.1 50S ribosomal protein L11 methyltransferase [Synechococcus sp. Cruz CV-v-12]
MARSWWRLEMDAPAELEESLLWKLGALGVQRVAIRHGPGTPRFHRLVAWLPAADWPLIERQRLEAALEPLGEPFGLPLPPQEWHEQGEEDWSSSWKQHWQADPVGQRLLILPAWLELPAEFSSREVILLDPGSAFGTGSHPTTRLCLEAIEAIDPVGWRVADLGCGSGILSLGALRLGAAFAAATDTDPLAVRATGENGRLNGLAVGPGETLQVDLGSVEALAGLLDGQPAELLFCNILAPVIETLAPQFHTVLSSSGVGLLSGLLLDQVPGLVRALAAAGWGTRLIGEQGGWGLLEIRRGAAVA